MANIKTYIIRRGLQEEVRFFGLKAIYISYFIGAAASSLIIGVGLSMVVSTIIGLITAFVLLISSFFGILFYSRMYGENGVQKKYNDASKPNKIKMSNPISSMPIWKK